MKWLLGRERWDILFMKWQQLRFFFEKSIRGIHKFWTDVHESCRCPQVILRIDLIRKNKLRLVSFILMAYPTFMGYLMSKPSWLAEEQQWYYLTHSSGYQVVCLFLKCICQNVNIVQLKLEHTYLEIAVQHFSHYTIGTLTYLLSELRS